MIKSKQPKTHLPCGEMSLFLLAKIWKNTHNQYHKFQSSHFYFFILHSMLPHIQDLLSLNLPAGHFAIFGSAPLAVRGLRESNDLDLIVTQILWQELCQKYPEHLKGDTGKKLVFGDIEIFWTWFDLTDRIDEIIASADVIEWLPFVRLEYVLHWKRFMGREKDKQDLELIENYTKTQTQS